MEILLVEDDERIVSFVKRGLEAEHYSVDVAHDGQEAIDMARAIRYRLIILDLVLPLKSGSEVCLRLREEQIETPILMLTAKDTLEEKVEGLRIGADDYLTKPFAFEELLARMKALLRRGPYREESQDLRVADLVLSRETHEVRRAGDLIALTAKEFALLEYLMSHPNKVMSRTSILEKVWGYHYDTLTNVVDVYIRYLRKKVDEGYPKKLIQTVRDIGYKICG
ncbi:MAG: response regulator transcription factor [Candidatus Manganitrophus sp. SA1]|nr:response regulator transcription factor [Candidatus Manganitrophus morganii]